MPPAVAAPMHSTGLPPRRDLRSNPTHNSNMHAYGGSGSHSARATTAPAAVAFTAATSQPTAHALQPHAQPLAAPAVLPQPVLKRAASASSASALSQQQAQQAGLQPGPVRHRLPGAAGQPRPLAEGAPPRTAAEQAAEEARQYFTVPEVVSDPSITRVNTQGVTVCKQYRRGRYLGKGGFAVCYELTSLDSGRTYAGKIIPRASLAHKPSAQKKMVHEIKIHRSIQHPNVVKFERFFEDNQNVYLLLELCTNHSLMELVRRRQRLTETETQFYMWQLVNTMSHLHSRNIIHRDLKLGNLFLNSSLDLRIGDFGLATQLLSADERKSTLCGTPNYIAPEILSKGGHSFEVDTWAMGVIMYTMLYGRPPFETNSVDSTYERIKGGVYSFPTGVHVSQAAKSMIASILHSQASSRPSLDELVRHEFFSQSPFPKQLPLSCLQKPLVWPPATQQAAQQQQQQQQQENCTAAGGAVPQQQQQQHPTACTTTAAVVPVSAATLTATTTTTAPSHRPALSSRTIATNNLPALAAAELQRKPTTTSASITTATSSSTHTAAPSIARPTTTITERRGTRRTAGEDARQHIQQQQQQAAASPVVAVDDLDAAVAALQIASSAAHVVLDSGSGGAVAGAGPNDAQAGAGADPDEDQEDVGALRQMHDEIERSFCGGAAPASAAEEKHRRAASAPSVAHVPTPAAPPALVPASLWVNRWVDYSNKYGLGYLLSNGSAGVYFNDSSKAVLAAPDAANPAAPGEEVWEYIERRGHAATTASATGTNQAAAAASERACYTLSNYPPSLQKKVTLLRHFSSHLQKPSAPSSSSSSSSSSEGAASAAENGEPQVSRRSPPKQPAPGSAANGVPSSPASSSPSSSSVCGRDSTGGLVYVKKWLRTKHAIFFRLSNRTVQVIFQDHTELVLCSQTNCVTYTDKQRRRETCSMDRSAHAASGTATGSDPLSDRPDLAKRMKYTKEILHLLLTRNAAQSAPTHTVHSAD